MKKFAALALVLLLTGCSEPEHVSVDVFKREYASAGQMGTMREVEYLGQRDGKAFIKIRSMRLIGSGWKEKVIFIELRELDSAFQGSSPKQPIQSTTDNSGAAPRRV